jgi:hypothetical protein
MLKNDTDELEKRKIQILSLIRDFCSQKLDDEYFDLSVKLINKLGRKKNVPFMTGKIEIWAAAVVHSLGSVNFLFDQSFKPFTTVDEINDFFGTKKTTTGNKSKEIRDLLKMSPFNNEFLTQHLIANNPMNNLVMVNGFIVKKDSSLE